MVTTFYTLSSYNHISGNYILKGKYYIMNQRAGNAFERSLTQYISNLETILITIKKISSNLKYSHFNRKMTQY